MITAETRGRLQLHSEVRFERKKGNYRPNQRSLVSAFLMRRGLALETLVTHLAVSREGLTGMHMADSRAGHTYAFFSTHCLNKFRRIPHSFSTRSNRSY